MVGEVRYKCRKTAGILALNKYINTTGDREYLKAPEVLAGISLVLSKLEEHRHDSISLYDTFFQPTDDMHVYPYLTSLLCGRKDHGRKILKMIKMDNCIACESVDEVTGESTTGYAFATCPGFLAYALYEAFSK